MKLFRILLICFSLIGCKIEDEKSMEAIQRLTIYTIGDSTMADKPDLNENPERGWGQMLDEFFDENVSVENHAANGRSTRSFINEKRWDLVHKKLKPGDYVFIQFGHNDQKVSDPNRYTNPFTAYRYNLIKFVNESREKNAIPILFTSIVRRNFNEDGTLVDTHTNYPSVVRQVAIEYNVPLVDLQYLTEKLEESYGTHDSKELHLHYRTNELPYYPEGKIDDTHLSVKGATEVAKLAVEDLLNKDVSLKNYIIKSKLL